MSLKLALSAALAACLTSAAAWAGDAAIHVSDAYARSAMANAKTGAAFMVIANAGTEADRLIGVASPAAAKVELHTHKADAEGVMKMVAIDGGIALPAGASHALARGGDHVMLMGLTAPLVQGDNIEVVLQFEKAGEIAVTVPVDLERQDDHGQMMQGHKKK